MVVLTIRDDHLQVLLVERGGEPFLGALALPGGFVLKHEGLDEAAVRELEEETGLAAGDWYLEQLGSYGAPDRDPRMRVVTVAYWAICAELPRLRAGGDAKKALLMPVADIETGKVRLAFDHEQIVKDALLRTRAKLEYTVVAAKFCPPQFTIGQLRRAHEAVWGVRLERGNFHRSVQNSPFVKPAEAGSIKETRRGPPAALWELADATEAEARRRLSWSLPIANRTQESREKPGPQGSTQHPDPSRAEDEHRLNDEADEPADPARSKG